VRIRSIKPEFWGSQSVGRLSRSSRLAFIGLWSCADDQGRFRADPRYLAGQLFPYDDDGLAVVELAMADLIREGSVTLYAVGPDTYGQLNGWKDHQKIDRPSKAKLPGLENGQVIEITEKATLARARRGLDEGSCEEGKGREGKGQEGTGGAPRPALARKSKPVQASLPEVIPAPPPRPPSRIGKIHEWFLEERAGRLTDKPPYGLAMAAAPPDQPPNWALSGATLTSWCALFPDWTEEDQDNAVKAMICHWLLEPYWAAPVDKKTGQPSTPYPWGAFLTEGQWRKAYEKLAGPEPIAAGAH
jgi:hypothetical protein